jgi:hypothetical protein
MTDNGTTAAEVPAPQCGAKLREGGRCAKRPVRGKRRCRSHGGAAGCGAPMGNKNALKHGAFTAASLARRKAMQDYIRSSKAFTLAVEAGVGRGAIRRYHEACERVADHLAMTTERLLGK